jgi:hypothetical protein
MKNDDLPRQARDKHIRKSGRGKNQPFFLTTFESTGKAVSRVNAVLLIDLAVAHTPKATSIVMCYKKTPFFFECFPYVCPEPVLVK